MNRDKSRLLFEDAQRFIPGGVNSPVRAFKSVGGTPVFFKSAKGAVLTDADGNDYIDYINSWGPMIMGHAYEPVLEAVREAAASSTSFGAPTERETRLARLICEMVPGLDIVRMVNSGTEACMSAVRVARGYTGRNKMIKFEGCYHGHGDSFLIKAGSGASTLGVPNSPGVTPGTAQDTLTAPYNDLEAVDALIAANPEQIACIIVEPVAGNMGCILPKEDYLQGLRARCSEHGIVLIFDEVMTGFRLAAGGVQERLGVQADLVTFGKVIGAGLPVGAYGGKLEIMEHVSPLGPVYQAGTLSGNPLAMAAGYALLQELHGHPEIYGSLEKKGAYLREGLQRELSAYDMPFRINQIGSMISLHFCENEVTDFASAGQGDNDHFRRFFHLMLDEGVYLPPSAYESWFLTEALTPAQLEHTIAAAARSVGKMVETASV